MQTRLAHVADLVHFMGIRLPFKLAPLMPFARPPTGDDDQILRRELERVQGLSPHLLADIGIDCVADAPLDELVQRAQRLKYA